jgi:hypothetical protein
VKEREREVNKRRQICRYTQEQTENDKIGIAEEEDERERWTERVLKIGKGRKNGRRFSEKDIERR